MTNHLTESCTSIPRREFMKTFAVIGTGIVSGANAFAEVSPKIKLGLDNFSVRAMKWNASQLIDYAASLKTDSLFITDLDAYESFEESYLTNLRKKAADNG